MDDRILKNAKIGFELTFSYHWTQFIGNREVTNLNEVIRELNIYIERLMDHFDGALSVEDFHNPNYENLCDPKTREMLTLKKFIIEKGNDKFWFIVNLDPGVVEIQTKPVTYNELKNNFVSNIMTRIFAYNAGHHGTGGGHINVDFITGFNGDHRLVCKTIDRIEHAYTQNEIGEYMDNLSVDEMYDPFISTRRLKVPIDRSGNWKIFRDKLDEDNYYNDWNCKVYCGAKSSIENFVKNHKTWLFTHPAPFQYYQVAADGSEFSTRLSANNDDVLHYQAVNIQHILPTHSDGSVYDVDLSDCRRVEFRFFKAQDNFDELCRDIEFINRMVNEAERAM